MAKPEAVIEIGSTGIRLLVAELATDGKRTILDRSELPVDLGRDVFTSGTVSRDSLLQSLSILNRFREQLGGWGITPDETTVIATSALREAKNRDPVLDRIMVKTGFRVKVIDGIEENRLMYLAVTECFKDSQTNIREQDSIILDVGGGSTEMMLIEKGKMAGAHSMRLGTVIIEQQLRAMMGSLDDARRYIDEFIRNTKGSLNNELNLSKVQQFIAIGSDARIAAVYAGRQISPSLWMIKRDDFDRFVNELQGYSTDECVAHFKISYYDAQSLHIGLLTYKLFVKLTNVNTILVPETSIRDGLIISKDATPNPELQLEFFSQVTASALNLLRKYGGDEKHAQYVRMISTKLFDALKSELGLPGKARMLLETAALLHDIGMFIRANDHNIHSKYIIEHSEIFGLNKDDITIVSHIARYHRGTYIPQDDPSFISLPRDERLTILKLTALIRVADALDRGHTQRISDFSLTFRNDIMTIVTDGKHHNVLEKIAVTEKSDIFESVFGYKVILA
jgi:exopolyphosphatase / guanosine-5'-triphosphate,3'-diphosphate pyrophosphatase